MRLGMISQWYEPESGSAAHPTAIARTLAERGHDVRVLTGFPSYPLGRVFDGYAVRPRHHETRDGVQLLRVPSYPSHDSSGARRALTLSSFAASSTLQVGWLRGADACLVYLTPATVGMAARALRRLSGVPYVLYVQDLWPESVTASGFIGNRRAVAGVEAGINRFLAGLYRHADSIAAISPGMTEKIAQRGGEGKTVTVPNWVDESIFRPVEPPPAAARELDGGLRWLMYAGGIGNVQGLDTAVRAVAMLGPDSPVRLALVGDGVALPELAALAADLGVADRVRLLGPRPMATLPALMAQAAAQLVSLRDLPVFAGTVPSKLQASMASGLPVVCSVAGDAARIVQDAGCGFTSPPDDPSALAGVLGAFAAASAEELAAMGSRGRVYYGTRLSAAAGGTALEGLLQRAVDRRDRR